MKISVKVCLAKHRKSRKQIALARGGATIVIGGDNVPLPTLMSAGDGGTKLFGDPILYMR